MPHPDLVDSFGRVGRKLRISVTDRCNFRCNFCMPHNPIWLPRDNILTFEEITRITRIFAQCGISKLRVSGGEPLVRREIEKLIAMLADVSGIRSLSMTTNGYFLAKKAAALKDAGLQSVTVSLHSLKPERFEEITGVPNVYGNVVGGIKAAQEVGLDPVKVNVVITRRCNEDEIVDFARLSRDSGLIVRFIEYMPFDGNKVWGFEKVFTGREIIERISEKFPMIALPREQGSTAKIYKFEDGKGEIGVITSMSSPFCGDCDRLRLTADGKVVPCLFSKDEYDIRQILRSGGSDGQLEEFIRRAVSLKDAGIETMLKQRVPIQHIRPMHTIGG